MGLIAVLAGFMEYLLGYSVLSILLVFTGFLTMFDARIQHNQFMLNNSMKKLTEECTIDPRLLKMLHFGFHSRNGGEDFYSSVIFIPSSYAFCNRVISLGSSFISYELVVFHSPSFSGSG